MTRKAPGEVYEPETGFHFDCATGSPGEVIKAAIAFGREQGEKGLRERLRALLGL